MKIFCKIKPTVKGERVSQVVLVVKNLPAYAGDIRDSGSIPGSGKSPGGGHANLFQYSCLGNPMDTEAWQAMGHPGTCFHRRQFHHNFLMSHT